MASEWDHAGTAGSDASGRVAVFRDPAAGDVKVVCSRPEVVLSPAAADDLAGLLGRAAMPGQPADVQPPAPLAYDPAIDNCGGTPGCGDRRVLFTWFHSPAICCPRCYVNLFGGEPEAGSVITIPAVPGQPGAAGEAGAGQP